MNQNQPHPGEPPIPTHVRCPNCNYDLTGAAIGAACPECGLVIGRGTFAAASNLPMSGRAIASLVLGIVSIVGCSTYGILSMPCGVIGIVLARSVKQQIVNCEVSPASAGMAKAGMVCSIVGLCLGGLALLFFISIILVPILAAIA